MENTITENRVPRYRTIKQCQEEIKQIDSQTAVSEWYIRSLCRTGKVKHFICGKSKILVNYDDLIRVLNFEFYKHESAL